MDPYDGIVNNTSREHVNYLQSFAHWSQFGADSLEIGSFVRLLPPALDHDGTNAVEAIL